MAATSQTQKDDEIAKLKSMLKDAYIALNTCKASRVGDITLQHFNTEKVRNVKERIIDYGLEDSVEEFERIFKAKKDEVCISKSM